MKKFAVIGASVFVLGVFLFTGALAASDWDVTRLSTKPPFEKKQYTVENSGQSISVFDSNMPVHIGVSADAQIHFEYYENEKEFYEIDNSTELKFIKQYNYKWYDNIINFDLRRPSFTVLLPAEYTGSIVAETSNGAIKIEDTSLGSVSLTTGNGKIELKNVTASGSAKAKTSNGKIEARGVTSEGGLFCTTSNAGLFLSQIRAQSLDAISSNGKIELHSATLDSSVWIETSNSKINLDSLKAGGDVTLKTGNGPIYGTIVGRMEDFSIISGTSNGKNNLPEFWGSGEQHLSVHTSNSNIDITFSGEENDW